MALLIRPDKLRLPLSGGMLVAMAAVLATAVLALDFPALTGRVVDNANLLTSHEVSRISARLENHEKGSSSQIVVVTLPSLQGTSIEDFGYQLGRHWAIGQAGRDNGVLLIVAPNERKVRIEVGYGLEGDLPDAIARAIIDNDILPAFRSGNYPRGIEAGVGAIMLAIAGAYAPREQEQEWDINDYQQYFFLLPIFLLAGVLFLLFLHRNDPVRYRHIPFGFDNDDKFGGGSRSSSRSGGFSGGGGSFGGGGATGSW